MRSSSSSGSRMALARLGVAMGGIIGVRNASLPLVLAGEKATLLSSGSSVLVLPIGIIWTVSWCSGASEAHRK